MAFVMSSNQFNFPKAVALRGFPDVLKIGTRMTSTQPAPTHNS